MKAILVNDDRSLRWDNVPDPVLGNDDCLIKIEAAALNRADLMQREGDYPPPAGCPEWMGLEIAGTIVEIADGAKEKSNTGNPCGKGKIAHHRYDAMLRNFAELIGGKGNPFSYDYELNLFKLILKSCEKGR